MAQQVKVLTVQTLGPELKSPEISVKNWAWPRAPATLALQEAGA